MSKDNPDITGREAGQIIKTQEPKELADFLDAYVNSFHRPGKKVGRELHRSHRTLQRSVIKLCLDIICGLSEQEHTDGRNEDAIRAAKKIKAMIESGEIYIG